jgi:hypothetical protein
MKALGVVLSLCTLTAVPLPCPLLQNNIAPLDENGGHSTLQFTYHVRSRPRVLRCHHFS